MRTMPPAIACMIALSLLLVSPTRALAQADGPELGAARMSAIARCAPTECILGGAPVLEAPFSAEAVTAWRPRANSGRPELHATARYYRDRAGRVRVDQFFVGHDLSPLRVIVTTDANSRSAYLLDPVARTASEVARGLAEMMAGGGRLNQFVLPLSTSRFVSLFPLQGASVDSNSAVDDESLGQRSMAGIQATGTRFRTRLPAPLIGSGRGERWVSPELKLVVYGRSEDSQIGILEYQLTRINRADPPPELFEVPADYVVTPAKFPVTWENPYRPDAGRLGPSLDRR